MNKQYVSAGTKLCAIVFMLIFDVEGYLAALPENISTHNSLGKITISL